MTGPACVVLLLWGTKEGKHGDGTEKKAKFECCDGVSAVAARTPRDKRGKIDGRGTLRRSVLCEKKDEKIVTRVRMGACR